MRRPLEAAGLVLLGVALGLGSLAAITAAIRAPHEERFGPWHGTSLVGRVPSGPYERVAIATRGLVGLPRSETVYLEARGFEPGCSYRITGPALPARWEPHTLRRRLGADPERRRRLLGRESQREAR